MRDGLKPIRVKFVGEGKEHTLAELDVVDLLFAILMFEQSAYVVSEGSRRREMIGALDGFVYLFCNAADAVLPDQYFARMEANDCDASDWIATGLAEFDD
jgi:hypothetical protein